MIPKYAPNYTCAACLDTKQNETIPQEAEYVATGNMPLYWCLCGKHYERLTVEQKTHYAKRSN